MASHRGGEGLRWQPHLYGCCGHGGGYCWGRHNTLAPGLDTGESSPILSVGMSPCSGCPVDCGSAFLKGAFMSIFLSRPLTNRVVERRATPQQAAPVSCYSLGSSWSDAATELSLKPAPLLILSLKCTWFFLWNYYFNPLCWLCA